MEYAKDHILPDAGRATSAVRCSRVCGSTANEGASYSNNFLNFFEQGPPAPCDEIPNAGLKSFEMNGAGAGTRTPDRLITNQVLYQLSYASSAGAS